MQFPRKNQNNNSLWQIHQISEGEWMEILLALVAFSVVMIVMSTIVTAFVQIVQRMRSIRERHLKFFLRKYFDEVLWPRFQVEISALNHFDGIPKIIAPSSKKNTRACTGPS
jgi:hypothetical protein